MLKVLDTTTETEETPATPTLDDLAREGARRMLMAALQVEVRSGPRNLDSGLSEISIVFQAAVPKLVASKYTTSGVRRPSEL